MAEKWMLVLRYPHEYVGDQVLTYQSETEAREAAPQYAKGKLGYSGYCQVFIGPMTEFIPE